MLSILKRSLANFFVDELIHSHKQGEASFKRKLNNYSYDQMMDIRRAITKQINRLSASIENGLKSKDCADKFTRLSLLKKIRAKVMDELKEKNNKKEPVVIDI